MLLWHRTGLASVDVCLAAVAASLNIDDCGRSSCVSIVAGRNGSGVGVCIYSSRTRAAAVRFT